MHVRYIQFIAQEASKMTVAELKKALEGVSDDAVVCVPVRTYTQAYPVSYIEPFSAQHMQSVGIGDPGSFRLYISLGEGVSVSKRKK